MTRVTADGVHAAIRHFPGSASQIEALACENESFRDLCDELAAAEEALAAVDRLAEAARAERRLEWLSFIRGALAEIGAELRRIKVVPIERGNRRKS